jgi:GAF domain-containing protein
MTSFAIGEPALPPTFEDTTASELLFARSMAEIGRELAGQAHADEVLRSITDLVTESVVCEGASITLVLSGRGFRTLAPTDNRISVADGLQYELEEGPCITAAFENGVFLVHDIGADTRWPRWGPRASQLGLQSILSVHLYTTRQSVGALNLYGTHRHRYDERDIDVALLIGAHASTALARLRLEEDLWTAVDARHLIGQAQGILMAQRKIGSEESFAVLQRHSQHTNRKLRDIADYVVRNHQLPE